MSPDQLLFNEHLKLPEYRQGEILGYWGRANVKEGDNELGPLWPYSLFWISVPARANSSLDKYFVRVELTNYNIVAPAGCFWDLDKNCRLENRLWPNVTGPFQQAFRTDWGNQLELYAPWDRGGINAHREWVEANAAVSWKSGQSKIHNYLEIMHEILNGENYHGIKG